MSERIIVRKKSPPKQKTPYEKLQDISNQLDGILEYWVDTNTAATHPEIEALRDRLTELLPELEPKPSAAEIAAYRLGFTSIMESDSQMPVGFMTDDDVVIAMMKRDGWKAGA